MLYQPKKATFFKNKNEKFLELLGFDKENIQSKLNKVLVENTDKEPILNNDLNSDLSSFNNVENAASVFDQISLNDKADQSDEKPARTASPFDLNFDSDIDKVISELLILGKYQAVVDLCIQENRYTEAILVASFFDQELFIKTQKLYFEKNQTKFSKVISIFMLCLK